MHCYCFRVSVLLSVLHCFEFIARLVSSWYPLSIRILSHVCFIYMAGEQLDPCAPAPWVEEDYVEEPAEDPHAEDDYHPDQWPYPGHY